MVGALWCNWTVTWMFLKDSFAHGPSLNANMTDTELQIGVYLDDQIRLNQNQNVQQDDGIMNSICHGL